MLFHHKGHIEDDFIKNSFWTTDEIVNSKPEEYTPKVFSAFREIIRTHIEGLWENFEDTVEGAMKEIHSGDFMDRYLSDADKGNTEKSILDNLSKRDNSMLERANNDTGDFKYEDKEVSKGTTQATIDYDRAKLFREREEKMLKPQLIPVELKAQIDSFSNISVFTTKENFESSEEPVEYDCIIFDATR